MTVLTVVVLDKTGFPTMTVSSQLTNDIADGKSYQFTDVNMGRYKKERVLKTTKMTKITKITSMKIST